MFKIAICDDEKNICSLVERMVLAVAGDAGLSVDTEIFYSGESLLHYLNPERFNALIGIALECLLFYLFFIFVILIRDFLQNNTIAIVDWAIAFITPLCISLVRTERNFNFLFFSAASFW